jgi:hypothetical protein
MLEKNNKSKLRMEMDASLPDYKVISIEGCEYFRFYSSNYFVHITHKGNCKNPIHEGK